MSVSIKEKIKSSLIIDIFPVETANLFKDFAIVLALYGLIVIPIYVNCYDLLAYLLGYGYYYFYYSFYYLQELIASGSLIGGILAGAMYNYINEINSKASVGINLKDVREKCKNFTILNVITFITAIITATILPEITLFIIFLTLITSFTFLNALINIFKSKKIDVFNSVGLAINLSLILVIIPYAPIGTLGILFSIVTFLYVAYVLYQVGVTLEEVSSQTPSEETVPQETESVPKEKPKYEEETSLPIPLLFKEPEESSEKSKKEEKEQEERIAIERFNTVLESFNKLQDEIKKDLEKVDKAGLDELQVIIANQRSRTLSIEELRTEANEILKVIGNKDKKQELEKKLTKKYEETTQLIEKSKMLANYYLNKRKAERKLKDMF